MKSVFEYTNNFHKAKGISSSLRYGNIENCLHPVISVIIPVYKKYGYLEKALESAINQNCSFEYEIVVVDNNAGDDINENQVIIEKINSPKVLYYKNSANIGMMNNWNRGIELSRAELITYCHDDDLLFPNTLQTLFNLYLKYKQAIMGAYVEIDEKGNNCGISQFTNKNISNITLFDMFINNRGNGEGCIFEKKLMLELGGFNDFYYPVSDYALFTCYVEKYGMKYYSKPIFKYRIAENESFSAVVDAPVKTRYILESIASKLKFPNLIKEKIVRARIMGIEQAAYKIWHCDVYKESKPKWTDQLIFSFLCKLKTMFNR